MHNYPSDITREQFEIIREDLENAKKRTKPRKYDLYDIFCGILYVLRGGIQWRMLPDDFPRWQLVYYYFTVWSKPDVEGISLLKKIDKKVRADKSKNEKTSFGIIDSKSIKNTDTAEEKDTMPGKSVGNKIAYYC